MTIKEKVIELKESGLSWKQVAEELEQYYPELTMEQRYDKARNSYRRENGGMEEIGENGNATISNILVKEKKEEFVQSNKTVSYNGNNGETTFEGIVALMDGEPITPESILKAHNLNFKEWEVVSYRNNFWQAQKKNGGTILLYQSKITVRPKKTNEITFEEVKEHFENFSKNYKHDSAINFPQKSSKKMLEVNIADLHFAKLAWHRECGENYDYKIAEQRFNQIVDAECERLSSGEFEKVLFVWTNDFFNSDNPEKTTTGGTPQSTDLRWQKMFLKGIEMLVNAIEKFQRYVPVETFYIASNHCRTTEFYAINYLYAWFKDNDRVTVDINCKARYYYKYGINLIGFSHSYYEKKQNLQQLMSVEVPEMWAETKYREFHLAHIHSEAVEEKGGIVFRWLPSVTGSDQWHYDCGYIGATKRSYSFAWNYNTGLESINVVHIVDI